MPQPRQLWSAGQETRPSQAHRRALMMVPAPPLELAGGTDSMRYTSPRVETSVKPSPSSITQMLSLGPCTTLTGETWLPITTVAGAKPAFTANPIWYPGITSGMLLGIGAWVWVSIGSRPRQVRAASRYGSTIVRVSERLRYLIAEVGCGCG